MHNLRKIMSRLMNKRRINIVIKLFIIISTILYTNNFIGSSTSTAYANPFDVCLDCTFKCTSNDVQLIDAWIVPPGGDPCYQCDPGTSVSADLYAKFYNNTGTDRNAVWLCADINCDGDYDDPEDISICVVDVMPAGYNTYLLGQVTWTCGEPLRMCNVVTSFSTTETVKKCTDIKGCEPRKSHCEKLGEFFIGTPPTCSIDPVEPLCEEDTVELNATVTGGTPSFTYSWDDGGVVGTFSDPNIEDPTWTPSGYIGTAILTLTVTDKNTCTTTCSVDVTVNSLPDCNITCDPEDCSACEDGGVTLTASDAEDWLWSTGKTTQSIIVTASGNYSVTVIDENGCHSTCYQPVTVNPIPDCNITAPDSVCYISTGITASTISGYNSYDWTITGGTITSGHDTDTITFDLTPGATTVVLGVSVIDSNRCENDCTKEIEIYTVPDCNITADPGLVVCEGVSVILTENGGDAVSWSWSTGETTQSITVNTSGTYSVEITDESGCESTCSVDLTVKPCPLPPCECSLVVEKRDEAGNIIEDAVFEVDGIEKTTSGGEARWDDLECDTTYEVRELSPIEQTERIHLGDCGERSTMRVVNKIEEGELVVAGIMEVLPFTGPAIPYSPFIGISTVLAGTVLYILSKPKKKR